MGEPIWMLAAFVVCAVCALISMAVAVFVWRQQEAVAALRRAIGEGDSAVMGDMHSAVDELREEIGDVRAIVARIEAQQSSQEKHVLHARDLSPLHEKINRVAEQQAESRGELNEVARMLREQLRILQTARGGT